MSGDKFGSLRYIIFANMEIINKYKRVAHQRGQSL
jgi:hypothetical protein